MGACLAVLVEDSEGSGHHVGQRKAALVVLVEEAEEGPLVVYLDWCVLGEPEYQYVFKEDVDMQNPEWLGVSFVELVGYIVRHSPTYT